MKHLVRAVSVLLLVILTSAGAQAVSLSNLFNGGSITAGDKLFDSWSLGFYDSSDGRTFNPANIDVTALNDGGMSPGPGLNFAISNSELNVTGDGVYAYVDLKFGFRASVLDPALMIKDNSLSIGAFLFGENLLTSTDLGVYMRETIGTAAGLGDLGTKEVEFSDLGGVMTSITSDSAAFAPQSEIWVTKNILVWSVDPTDTAGLFSIDQRFSQTDAVVPEPSTLLLVGLGLAGLVTSRRAKKL
jgi:hypothetical protein